MSRKLGPHQKAVMAALHQQDIFPRRYFYPSLEEVGLYSGNACPVSNDTAKRILCLPIYNGLDAEKVTAVMTGVLS